MTRWPSLCLRCGYDKIKRGQGTYWQCKRCNLDGGYAFPHRLTAIAAKLKEQG